MTDAYWQERILQNQYVPVNCRLIHHSLLPVAKDLVEKGEGPFALWTAMQMMNENMRAHQPTTVHFASPHYAHNQAGMRRYREM